MSEVGLEQLRSFYPTGEEIELEGLPPGTTEVVGRRATGAPARATVSDKARIALGPGTYTIEAHGPGGEVLAAEITTVAGHPGERPVHGFATSFSPGAVPGVAEWLGQLRCTVVQVYDWMHAYTAPLGPADGWRDPMGREVSFAALRSLAAALHSLGATAHAYAPIYAIDPPFAEAHPEMLLYRGDGRPERLFEMIQLADPANRQWQEHFARTYGEAADAIGFDGFHIDTYGFPRAARDLSGAAVDMRRAYQSFLAAFRSARPAALVSFNQVNGVPSAFPLPDGPTFRYCEVWAPNDEWRHFEGLLDRGAGEAGMLGNPRRGSSPMRGTIACYPPVWPRPGAGDGPAGAESGDALRTVVLTEAVATCLGASALIYGDAQAALCDAYYPNHQSLSLDQAHTVTTWHRFALSCRDLFLEGEDTSWYDIGDDNGAVAVEWLGAVRPEPVGGAVFARVVRHDDCIAVGLVDLSGSNRGSWSEPTGRGRCSLATVRALLNRPEAWTASVAVVGRDHGQFRPVPFKVVEHREGFAAEVEVNMTSGWSVLRFMRTGVGGGR